jgi:hypothetical protein
MLEPEHYLSEPVEKLFHVRHDGPDACLHGYEEADGDMPPLQLLLTMLGNKFCAVSTV